MLIANFLQTIARKKQTLLLILLLITALIIKAVRISQPTLPYFDEAYHVSAAKLIAENNPQAYEWWRQPVTVLDKKYVFDWLHPPLAKLVQAAAIKTFGLTSWAWRLPSLVASLFLTLVVFELARISWRVLARSSLVTDDDSEQKAGWFGLLAALLLNLSGLVLVQSRIAMNDIFVSLFVTAGCYFYLLFVIDFWQEKPGQASLFEIKKEQEKDSSTSLFRFVNSLDQRWLLLLSGVLFGLGGASKWSGFWPLMVVVVVQALMLLAKRTYKLIPLSIFCLLLLPGLVYLLSYGQMFAQGKTLSDFYQLQKNIIWYQTHRYSGHPYASQPLAWFFNLRPVWYWRLESADPELTGNIYVLGNLSLQWLALPSLVFSAGAFFTQLNLTAKKVINNKKIKLSPHSWSQLNKSDLLAVLVWLILLAVYFSAWLPWTLIRRVGFYYHYLPAMPFLVIFIAYFLMWLRSLSRWSFWLLVLLIAFNFITFYPHWTGIAVSKLWAEAIYYSLSSWR